MTDFMADSRNDLIASDRVEGTAVYNREGEHLGKIDNFMVEKRSGQVRYAVLSFGGFLGMGDKYFAVPFNQFSVDRENKRMVLNVDKERLKDAPGFDKDDWPDFADPRFRDSVSNFYAA